MILIRPRERLHRFLRGRVLCRAGIEPPRCETLVPAALALAAFRSLCGRSPHCDPPSAETSPMQRKPRHRPRAISARRGDRVDGRVRRGRPNRRRARCERQWDGIGKDRSRLRGDCIERGIVPVAEPLPDVAGHVVEPKRRDAQRRVNRRGGNGRRRVRRPRRECRATHAWSSAGQATRPAGPRGRRTPTAPRWAAASTERAAAEPLMLRCSIPRRSSRRRGSSASRGDWPTANRHSPRTTTLSMTGCDSAVASAVQRRLHQSRFSCS